MKGRTRHFLSVLVVAGIVSFVAEPSRAELITYYFTGEITSVPNPPPYGLSISVGDPVTGSIAYDPSLDYVQPPPSGMSVVIGGATVQSVGNASLQVLNDSFGVDNFNGYFTPISVNGQQQPEFSHAMNFSLTDTSQTVFSSTALPDSLNVSSFDIRTGAIFAGLGITVSFSIDTLSLTPPVDHFLGYKLKATKGATEVFTPPAPVTLTGQSSASAVFDVKKPLLLYTPANKNGEGIGDENTHLEAYSLKLTKTDPPQPKPTERRNVHVQNQFGDLFVDVGKPDRLLVPTAKNLTEPADLPGPNTVDHYRCDAVKTIKGMKFTPILGVSIDDQFIANPGKKFDLKKLLRLCTPVKKNDEAPINNPDTLLLCYQAKITKGEPKHEPQKGVHLHNQFGQEQVDTVSEVEFCIPTTEVEAGTLAAPDAEEIDADE